MPSMLPCCTSDLKRRCKNPSFARHYDQIRFRFRTASFKKRRKNMSAVTAAFAESSHGGPILRDRDEHCASKVRQAAPRCAGGRSACVFRHDPCSDSRRFRLTSGAATGHGEGVQRACAAPASRSDSPHRSPAAFRPAVAVSSPAWTKRPRSAPGDPMDLGSMRANGVRSLAVMCHRGRQETVLRRSGPAWHAQSRDHRCRCEAELASASPVAAARASTIRHCWAFLP
jgi:hypothetical protein